jgi:hypothetical protein
MALSLFDPAATRSVIADWVELALETSSVSVITDSAIRRAESVREEPENGVHTDSETGEMLEEEILESSRDRLVDAVWQELTYRQRVLGAVYPYVIKARGHGWTLSRRAGGDAALRAGRLAYRFCLLDSALRYGLIVKVSGREPEHDQLAKDVAGQFQALSFVGAHRLIGGKAHWFGWPRPDGSNFPSALAALVKAVGHGKVKDKPPAYSTAAEKDGTIDLVIWRGFGDSRYGSCIVYGQVASGSNWMNKPIKAFIGGRFFDWFEDKPSENYLPALFIPFPLHERVKEKNGISFDEVAIHQARSYEMDYGTIVDRLRLAELVHGATENCARGDELLSWGWGILRWIAACRKYVATPI